MNILPKIKFVSLFTLSLGLLLFLFNAFYFTEKSQIAETFVAKKADLIQKITIAGSVVSERTIKITAPFNGYVHKLYVNVGDKVKKGDPVVSVVRSLQSTDPVYPLRAPFEGVVVEILMREGEFVKEHDLENYLLRIDNLNKLYLLSNVAEMDHSKMRNGQSAVIKFPAILNETYSGKVEEVSLASIQQDSWAASSKVEFRTKTALSNFDERVRPGMSAILDIVTQRKDNVIVLPHEYIIKDGVNYFALIEGNKRIPITVGLQNESFFEVTSGLTEGQRVYQVDFLNMLEGRNR